MTRRAISIVRKLLAGDVLHAYQQQRKADQECVRINTIAGDFCRLDRKRTKQ